MANPNQKLYFEKQPSQHVNTKPRNSQKPNHQQSTSISYSFPGRVTNQTQKNPCLGQGHQHNPETKIKINFNPIRHQTAKTETFS